MKKFEIFLAVTFLFFVCALGIAGGTTGILQAGSDEKPTTATELTDSEAVLEGSSILDALVEKDSILDRTRSEIVICDTRTCECYDCQFGGPCVPVPPPAWCQ